MIHIGRAVPDKPICGSKIDWTHPFSRNLVGCWLFNERAGSSLNNLARQSPIGSIAGDTHSWATDGIGLTLVDNSSQLGPAYVVSDVTAIVSWIPRRRLSGYDVVIAGPYNSYADSSWGIGGNWYSGPTDYYPWVAVRSGADVRYVVNTTKWSVGVRETVALSRKNTQLNLHRAGLNTTYGSCNSGDIVNPNISISCSANATYLFLYIYRETLADADIKSIMQYPYDMIYRRTARKWFIPSGYKVAVFHNHYHQQGMV
jgi:hypothetical protein